MSPGRSPPPGPLDAAKAVALRYLSSRARTEAQIRDRLVRRELGESAEEVLGWLRRLGYLDDAAYARSRARSLVGRLAPAMAERRLEAAGVDGATARAAVAAAAAERAADARCAATPGAAAELPEVALCREALARKLGGADLASLGERERARLGRVLAGRGYAPAVVARVVGLPEE